MRPCQAFWGERGQATVETLAVVPVVLAAAMGLFSAGLWLREEHLSEAAVASRAIESIASAQTTTGSVNDAKGTSLRTVGPIGEARTIASRRRVLGVSITPEASIRWARLER